MINNCLNLSGNSETGESLACRMPWNEFLRYFTDLSVCQLFNTSLFAFGTKFHEWKFFDEWNSNGAKHGAPNDRAGGCLNFLATFCSNPQVFLKMRLCVIVHINMPMTVV